MQSAFKHRGRFMVFLLTILVFFTPHILTAGDKTKGLRVAVAANFLIPMEEIITLFSRDTGIHVEVSAGSTGKLYAQIKHGAPFDLFLAADAERPRLLFDQGLAGEPVVYAVGEVRLWSSKKMKAADWRSCLNTMEGKKIAMAQPNIAPYGKAAREGLLRAELWERIQPRLVYGQSVAQTFQFALSGGVEAAFVSSSYALSELGRKGDSRPVPEAGGVIQEACVILKSQRIDLAKRFLGFVSSTKVQTIIQRYGYH